jgi:predicted ArsR family transcriptional regulator
VKTATRNPDLRTRDQVARVILETGPSTAVVLAELLNLTPAGIRRHLDALIEEGLLEEREPYLRSARTRGRPSKVFVMSDKGRELFEHSYDDLAVSALKYLAATGGDHHLAGFARHRADEIVRKGEVRINASGAVREKSRQLAKFLTDEGYAASSHSKGIGVEICQHHCPIAHVAAEFPQLCEEETKAFSTLMGSHVQRLATIADGDGVCTTFIPEPALTSKAIDQKNRKGRP